MLLAFNKPYGVLCQFSPSPGKTTLADYIDVPAVYPAGRLDFDSEGLLLLTDDGTLQHRLAHPAAKVGKRYWAQVDGLPQEAALQSLRAGLHLGDFITQAAKARVIEEPVPLWPRHPPIRYRAHIPTSWLELEISEGKHRQVRRMTAAIGHPTLRLIRCGIGALHLDDLALQPGQWQMLEVKRLGLPETDHKPASTSTRNVLSTDLMRRRYRK